MTKFRPNACIGSLVVLMVLRVDVVAQEPKKLDLQGQIDRDAWQERSSWTQRMYKRGYVSNSQADSDQTKLDAAQLALNKLLNTAADKKEIEKKGKIVRARDLIEFRNHFKNLGIAYATFEAERGKGPANLDELKPYLQGANKMIDMLAKEEIIFFYGVSKSQMMANGTSNTILAHEAYEDVNGRRLVLMGDGSVQEMTNEQFQKAPKAKK